MFLDIAIPVLTVVAVVWVLRSKFAKMRGDGDALASLANNLGLSAAAKDHAAVLSPAEHHDVASSAVGRAGLAAIRALPAAQGVIYEGRIDGVRVRLTIVSENRGRTVLTDLSAQPGHPWNMGLHMEREHAMDHVLQPQRQKRDVITGDAMFDRAVFVQSSDQKAAEHVLRNETLRRAIAALLDAHARATIRDDGVYVQLPGPETNVAVVRPLLSTMAELVKQLDAARVGAEKL